MHHIIDIKYEWANITIMFKYVYKLLCMQIKYVEMNVIRGVGYQLINLPTKILLSTAHCSG